jgi:hypothetical protein
VARGYRAGQSGSWANEISKPTTKLVRRPACISWATNDFFLAVGPTAYGGGSAI